MLRKILWTLCLGFLPLQGIFAMGNEVECIHSDEALRFRSSQLPQAKSVVALEADVFFLRVSTGSAVCIGPGEFLTNAHCLEPWLNKNGKLKFPLYIHPEGQARQAITEIYMHETYSEDRVDCDIAYVRTKENNTDLAIQVDYKTAVQIAESKQFDVIGYRANSGKRGWGRCDGKKRAIVVVSSQRRAILGIDHKFDYVSCVYGGNDDLPSTLITPRKCIDYEVGLAAGISGGGVFINETSFVGLSTRFYFYYPSLLQKMRIFLFQKFKMVGALGIPVPFIGQPKGSYSGILPLVYFKDWIEEHQKIEKANTLKVVSTEDRIVTFLSCVTNMYITWKYALNGLRNGVLSL